MDVCGRIAFAKVFAPTLLPNYFLCICDGIFGAREQGIKELPLHPALVVLGVLLFKSRCYFAVMQEWLGKVVDREDFTRHDKWLCMMMPRLKLLRELLRENGAIFVNIDDNEVHHLRMLMDEVFQGNFVADTQIPPASHVA